MSSSLIVFALIILLVDAQQPTTAAPVAHFVDGAGRTALLWSSIGLAVLTSVLQGLVSTMILIAEDQAMWTFRFRIARYEHYWWTMIGILLSSSFGLIVISFLAGNNNDSVGVLALSTATAIVIVRYAIPAWRQRHFIRNRWLAWTGPSRTGVAYQYGSVCGNEQHWRKLDSKVTYTSAAPPSDDWGLAMRPDPGNPHDPTEVLNGLGEVTSDMIYSSEWSPGPCVFDDGFHGQYNVNSFSLLWGEREGFRRRASRAVNSMPQSLLQSHPLTVDLYRGDGLTLAMGVLGRNKGLVPKLLVYDWDDSWKLSRGIQRDHPTTDVVKELEDSSSWYPRPNKVMRSYYRKAMEEQYGTFPRQYIAAANELAIILLDCTPQAIQDWFTHRLEQQSLEVNIQMSRPSCYRLKDSIPATDLELQTLYRAQYVSMILSLNYFPSNSMSRMSTSNPQPPYRPDLHCFALLFLAEGAVFSVNGKNEKGKGAKRPDWWGHDWVRARLESEASSLQGNWKQCAAWLLGLVRWPAGLDEWPSWPEIVYEPERDPIAKEKT